MSVYYNEIDPFAAAWLRELMKAGQIPDGEVDERSIKEVTAADVRGFRQCHFFAGIGGWAYALRLAGWHNDHEVWTGSCPCQPFSSAGKSDGATDPRHLWPAWFRLVCECHPHVVFGEQVASPDGLGWFDRVSTDLEGAHYAVVAADLCAASVGAFHIRQRLWFVADAEDPRRRTNGVGRFSLEGDDGLQSGWPETASEPRDDDQASGLADTTWRDQRRYSRESRSQADARGGQAWPANGHAVGSTGGLGDSGAQRQHEGRAVTESGCSFWSAADWLDCIDGKARPVEPGTFPLADGLPARVGRLRGYGNAIVPQVAQVFIEAYLDVCDEAVRT